MFEVYAINHRTHTQYTRGEYGSRAKAEYVAVDEVLHAAPHVESGVLDEAGEVLARYTGGGTCILRVGA